MRKVLLAIHLAVMACVLAWWLAPRTPDASDARLQGATVLDDERADELAPPTALAPPTERADGRRPDAGASLRLVALDPDGAVLARTRVRVRSPILPHREPAFVAELATDERGELALDVPADTPLFVKAMDRFARDTLQALSCAAVDVAPLTRGEARTVELRFHAGCESAYRLRFVRAEDGAHVARGSARALVPVDPPRPTPVAPGPEVARVDAEGRAEFCIGVQGLQFVQVACEDRSPCVVYTWSNAEEPRERDVRLERAATLVLRVHDRSRAASDVLRATTACLAASLVPLELREERAPTGWIEWGASVEDDGRARLEGLPSLAPLKLALAHDGSPDYVHPEPIVLQPGEARELVIVLDGGTDLAVTVLDQDERPVAERRVGLLRRGVDARPGDTRAVLPSNDVPQFEQRTWTDEHGVARFEHVAPGAWWVALAPTRAPWSPSDPDAVAPIAERIELAPGEPARTFVLHAPRGLYVRGRVETPDGKLFPPDADKDTAPNVILIAQAVEIGGGLTGQPELDGSFAIGPVTTGEFVIETFSRGYAPIEPVCARAGGPPIVIRMQLGARITGRIVDAATREVVRSEVVLTRVDRDEAETLGSGDTDGAFAFDGLAAGEYVVGAFTQDGRIGASARVRVAAGAALGDVAIELAPLARTSRVRVVVEGDVEPGRIGLWQDGACRSAQFVNGAGVFTLSGGAGAAEVRLADARTVLVRRAVVLVDGATTDIRIER
ncbi:MAG: carboxypeptidase regulatory-like domain-containing protein [Planctomycetes bacterium]|nr:carboxypeptidase regulatory-like domain-containing protein [Planctomycetota bacterium]